MRTAVIVALVAVVAACGNKDDKERNGNKPTGVVSFCGEKHKADAFRVECKLAKPDLAPLASFTALRTLRLNAVVEDLTGLERLTSLESLSVVPFDGTDLGPLGPMSGLKQLALFAPNIVDVTPLGRLAHLEALDVNFAKQLRDISALSNLRKLEDLSIDGTGVESLVPLAALPKLRILSMVGTNVTKLDPLETVSTLEGLIIGKPNVTELAAEIAALKKALPKLDVR